jgi:hypothetical protein
MEYYLTTSGTLHYLEKFMTTKDRIKIRSVSHKTRLAFEDDEINNNQFLLADLIRMNAYAWGIFFCRHCDIYRVEYSNRGEYCQGCETRICNKCFWSSGHGDECFKSNTLMAGCKFCPS